MLKYFLLLFTIIFLYIYIKSDNVYESFKNDKDDDDEYLKDKFMNSIKPDNKSEFIYNLNDILLGFDGSANLNLIKYNCKSNKKYNDTLICKYFDKYKNRSGNKIHKMYRLMKDNNLLNMNLDNILVIHLRLGDAFTDKYALKEWKIHEGDKFKEFIVPPNIRTVHIYSGSHLKISEYALNKSIEYIKNVKRIFENKNLKTKLILGGDVDNSFINMCNSKHYIQSNGGFSETIAKIVKMNNGIVYNL